MLFSSKLYVFWWCIWVEAEFSLDTAIWYACCCCRQDWCQSSIIFPSIAKRLSWERRTTTAKKTNNTWNGCIIWTACEQIGRRTSNESVCAKARWMRRKEEAGHKCGFACLPFYEYVFDIFIRHKTVASDKRRNTAPKKKKKLYEKFVKWAERKGGRERVEKGNKIRLAWF